MSEPKTQEIDPREVGIAPETEPPGRIYKQVVREVLARIDQRLADIERHAVSEPSDGQPLAAVRAPLGGRLKRAFIGLLLVGGVAGAALVWQRSDGDSAKAMVARFTPRFLTNAQDDQETTQGTSSMTVGTAAESRASSEGRSALADVPTSPMDHATQEPDGQTAPSTDMASTIEKMSRDMV